MIQKAQGTLGKGGSLRSGGSSDMECPHSWMWRTTRHVRTVWIIRDNLRIHERGISYMFQGRLTM